jgi:hypothetical protein
LFLVRPTFLNSLVPLKQWRKWPHGGFAGICICTLKAREDELLDVIL